MFNHKKKIQQLLSIYFANTQTLLTDILQLQKRPNIYYNVIQIKLTK